MSRTVKVPDNEEVFEELNEFPRGGREGEAEFLRSIIFCTRLIPAINECLIPPLRADWGIIPYFYRGEGRLQEIDIGIYNPRNTRVQIWNGSRHCNIRIAYLNERNARVIIECKKNLSLNKRLWTDKKFQNFCKRLAPLRIPLWLIGEECRESDYSEVNRRAYDLGFSRVYIFSTVNEAGDAYFRQDRWVAFFRGLTRLRLRR